MRNMFCVHFFSVLAITACLSSRLGAQEEQPSYTLITNVNIFDGVNDRLTPGSVLIEDNLIKNVGVNVNAPQGTTVIDGGGCTLMPGLTDAHWHALMSTIPFAKVHAEKIGYVHIVAGIAAGETLMRGFTTVRDAGGPVFGLKRAIDEGIIDGPRIFPSGAMISQTSGHGDFRSLNDVPNYAGPSLSYFERIGAVAIADGRPAVLQRTREQLMHGASQIKLMAGGGVASNYDPLDVTQYTEDELRAAVQAAENWDTYVTVHAYTPRAIQQAVRAGVRCIEHGQLIDDETAKLLAEKDVWLSLQPFLDDEDAIPFNEGSVNKAKQLEMMKGTDLAYRLARKYKVKVAFGTDTVFDAKLATRQGAQLAKLTRWYTPFQTLKMATHDNAQLFALSGKRNPYPGKLGVVEEGALADLLLVDGNPLEDISLIADPEKNFKIIMKDGKVYKNTLK